MFENKEEFFFQAGFCLAGETESQYILSIDLFQSRFKIAILTQTFEMDEHIL